MANSQPALIVRDDKKYVSLDHVNAILASLPDNPIEVTISSDLNPLGLLQKVLQVQPVRGAQVGDDGRSDDDSRGSGTHKGGYQDAPALLRQLKDLKLDKEIVLARVLNNEHVPALDELDKAKGSLVRLATARDGRVFSVLVGSLAKVNWDGRYPIEGFMGPAQTRKMDDDMLHQGPITLDQINQLKKVLHKVRDSEAGRWFRDPMQVLWPGSWQQYHQLIERPVDFRSLEQNLDDNKYQAFADFMRDLELLRVNTVTFFGSNHVMSSHAAWVVDLITGGLWNSEDVGILKETVGSVKVSPAPPRSTAGRHTRWSEKPEKAPPALFHRSKICTMVYRLYVPNRPDVSGFSPYPRFVIPLGRVCVASSPNTEMYATRCILVMDIASPRKALWLVWDCFTIRPDIGPYRWLPNEQSNLVYGGKMWNSAICKLADDISLWNVGSGDSVAGETLLGWDDLYVPERALPRSVGTHEVLFDHAFGFHGFSEIQHSWRHGNQSALRRRGRGEQGSQADDPAAKRSKPNKT